MMSKKNKIAFVLIGYILCTSVSGAQTKTTTNNTKPESGFSGLLGKITGSSHKQMDLAGTWEFQGTSCAFETDNLLKKAGGAIVATQVESKFDGMCQSAGINKGNTRFVFNTDSTYSANLGFASISGKYSLTASEPQTQLTMTYLLGLGKLNAVVRQSGSKINLLFDADSMLKLMKILSKFTDDSSVAVLAKMNDMYDGMLLGFELHRK